MKAMETTKRTAALGLSALLLSSVMLCAVACTRDDHKNPGDTTAGGTQDTNKPTVTTPVTDPATGTGTNPDTAKPLDPDAGTVKPNEKPSDPPAGTTDEKSGRSVLPNFMK
jgi:hypothetical protein